MRFRPGGTVTVIPEKPPSYANVNSVDKDIRLTADDLPRTDG